MLLQKQPQSTQPPQPQPQQSRYPISFGICYGGRPQPTPIQAAAAGSTGREGVAGASHSAADAADDDDSEADQLSAMACFPANVSFRQCNFVQQQPEPNQPGVQGEGEGDEGEGGGEGSGGEVGGGEVGGVVAPLERFDVVTCLSTSKWIHLNFGDEGLRRLFTRAHACLRPGGRFLLEPQPWSSYRKRAHLTPVIEKHFRQIELRPPQFADVLLSGAVGFASAETVEVPYAEGAAKNWVKRPLLVLTKAEGVTV